ncbi:MAG TPA: monovalent cation/H+ antiporter complex subunit F [Prosthecobacter sp.]|nr:monovalent cation/H+ antiporter complex subunit F [Prosthecobacter sp.]HRK13462.1 monovalent cation/H+ antiporter complex subunit F [Prosthecobacter sp.]
MNLEEITTQLCGLMLGTSVLLIFWRFWRGPTDADRVLAIDLAAVVIAAAMIVNMVRSGEAVFLDAILLMGGVLFFSTIAFARALEVRNQKRRIREASHDPRP